MIDIKLIKSLIKGLLTFIPGLQYFLKLKKSKSKHSGSNAEFCYNLWLHILIHLNENKTNLNLSKIGEIGNGGSFGVGICALLSGTKKYFALEIEEKYDKEQNIILLNEIVKLFEKKTPITQNSKISININCLDYPESLIEPLFLDKNVIDEIKKDILSDYNNKTRIQFIKNWHIQPQLDLDFIFSRAVMEHVYSPSLVYESAFNHIHDKALMFHDIEFHSHGITTELDGHYKIPKILWRFIYGKRNYFLNRWSLSKHIKEIMKNNCNIIKVSKKYNKSLNCNDVLISASILLEKK